ncbi:undecaprenyl diphosphate synthase family protein, partial [bacterium]|nr:undecaprenyl diphosphate synthase family protein [bacterium]
ICNNVQNGQCSIDDINAQMISDNLYTKTQPDPDLIIRTSGEERISNFLLWQLAYSELWFTDKLWPDFNVHDLHRAIIDYQNRNRRYGGV